MLEHETVIKRSDKKIKVTVRIQFGRRGIERLIKIEQTKSLKGRKYESTHGLYWLELGELKRHLDHVSEKEMIDAISEANKYFCEKLESDLEAQLGEIK